MQKLALSINGTPVQNVGGVPTGGINELSRIIQVGFGVLVVGAILLALVYLVWGGFDWIVSNGNKQKLDQARQKVVFAIIGLIIVFVSFLIINLIQYFFNVQLLTIPGQGDVPCSRPAPGGRPLPC